MGYGGAEAVVVLLKYVCNPGEYSSPGNCTQCPAGTYSSSGATSCSSCSTNNIANQAGQEACLSEVSYSTSRVYYGTSQNDLGTSIVSTRSGNLYLLSLTPSNTNYNLSLIKTNFQGFPYFKIVLENCLLDDISRPLIEIMEDETAVFISAKNTSGSTNKINIHKFSSTGSLLWTQESSGTAECSCVSMKIGIYNTVLLSGRCMSTNQDFFLNVSQDDGNIEKKIYVGHCWN